MIVGAARRWSSGGGVSGLRVLPLHLRKVLPLANCLPGLTLCGLCGGLHPFQHDPLVLGIGAHVLRPMPHKEMVCSDARVSQVIYAAAAAHRTSASYSASQRSAFCKTHPGGFQWRLGLQFGIRSA